MKSLIRTISVFVVFALVTGCFALAKDRTVVERREADRAVQEQERQLQAKKIEMDKEDLLIAQDVHLRALATRSQFSGDGGVLVIPAAQSTAEELLTITEDMSVMLYIFDEKLGQVHMVPAFLGDITFLTRDGSGTRGIYLDGYGALFLMKVDFPLSPPAEAAEEEKPKEGVDSVWQEARRKIRRKIYEPERREGERYYTRRRGASRTRPEEKYDAEKVEELKRKLIRALKHAANIRNLKPDEQVILSVTGRGESDRVTTEVKVQMIPESGQVLVVKKSGDREETRIYPSKEVYTASLGPSSPTVMTIRAKKADVDAFAKGELDFDKFRQKVQIFTY